MIHERRTTVNRRTIRYLEAGLGRPIVLLHAFPLTADMWRAQLDAAPKDCRLIAPDLRGFGGSSIDRLEIGIDDYAADIVKLMDSLLIDRFAVAGLSMGGYIAFGLLRLARQRITGLAFADTRSTADTDAGREVRAVMLADVRRNGVGILPERMIPKLLGETSRSERPEVVATTRRLIEANRRDGVEAAIYALMRRPDSTGDLGRIDVPTVVVVGHEDELTPPSDSEALHRAIRGSRLTVIPRAGHLSNLEVPDAFSTTINEWAVSLRS
jgi:pimeloyl-ACP methyl ester carboxylesterase